MRVISTYLLTILTATLLLGACSLTKQKSSLTKIDQASDLFLDRTKIIGGEPLSSAHLVASHVVAIYDTVESSLCTGSIIAEDIILTAGHCIPKNPANLVLLFGVDALNYDDFRRVQFAGAHKDFEPNDTGKWSDIGLIYFTGGLPEGFTPISILDDEIFLQKGVTTELAGYGQSDGVKHTGSGLLRHVTVQVEDPAFAFGEVEINQTNGLGACHGDSGGPALIEQNSQIKLWGITSRGEKDEANNCDKYSVYTNAVTYTPWINAAVHDIHEAVKQLNLTTIASSSNTKDPSALMFASANTFFR